MNIRKALMDGTDHESKYLGVGADAIQYRMVKLGFSVYCEMDIDR
ncbi:MAG: hypothetical protein ACNYWM_04465 [Methanosarcinales archaeon]